MKKNNQGEVVMSRSQAGPSANFDNPWWNWWVWLSLEQKNYREIGCHPLKLLGSKNIPKTHNKINGGFTPTTCDVIFDHIHLKNEKALASAKATA